MEFPIEIQKLIKEFSMPKYKKPLHYKAYLNHPRYFLKETPYTNMEEKLDNNDFITDMIRGDECRCWFYTYVYNYNELIISDEDVELEDIIVL